MKLQTRTPQPFKPFFHRGCLVERIPHNGMYVTRHETEGRLMADTQQGLKALIRGADERAKMAERFNYCESVMYPSAYLN